MIIILSYFMFLLLCVMYKTLLVYGKNENIDAESIGLTCFGIPILACVWGWIIEAGVMQVCNSVIEKVVLGFGECFGMVLILFVGYCLLEYYIAGKYPSKLQVFLNKSKGALIVISICMLMSGIGGGLSGLPEEYLHRVLTDINKYLGYWMIFISYGIISITFFATNVTKERFGNELKRWKSQDGKFLVLMKWIVVGTSIGMKTLWFINMAQPLGITYLSVKYEWIGDLERLAFRMQQDGFKYMMLCIMPLLIVLYIVAVDLKENNSKTDVVWGCVVFGECLLTGWIGQFLWFVSWR